MTIAALIVAAGRGARANTHNNHPKQYVALSGTAVLAHTAKTFFDHELIEGVQVVVHHDDHQLYQNAMRQFEADQRLLPCVNGGATRQASVLAGLEALAELGKFDVVLIHDAARPFLTQETIDGILNALSQASGAIAATPVTDTIKRVDQNHMIDTTVSREELWCAQTPQGFKLDVILEAHRKAAKSRENFTDDAGVAEWAGHDVAIVNTNSGNQKLTTSDDMEIAAFRLGKQAHVDGLAVDLRIGSGFDVHRFEEGDHVWLGGVKIPHTMGLKGHSDADVVLHALTDALLGAIAQGDIGTHFPPSDPKWRGASSDVFLADAWERLIACRGKLMHADITIICEAPKIGPHAQAIRGRISQLLNLGLDRISVKATTTEGLGFAGRREGIAAQATATVMLPI